MFNESKLRNFIHIADAKSFIKAAEDLFITQQALSKQIALLEKDIGTTLFIRSNKGVTLTENGKLCYDAFSRFLHEYDAYRERFSSSTSITNVNIGIQNWFEFTVPLKTLEHSLRDRYSISTTCYPIHDLVEGLISGELDVIVMLSSFLPSLNDSFDTRLLAETPMVILSSIENRTCARAKKISDFDPYAYIGFPLNNETPQAAAERTRSLLGEYGLSSREIVIARNSESVLFEMEIGHGVCIMPLYFNRYCNPAKLNIFTTNIKKPLLCIWRKNNPVISGTDFVDAFIEECRNHSGWSFGDD